MITVNGLPKAKKNLEAFVDAGTVAKNVTLPKGAFYKAGSVIGGFLKVYNSKGKVAADATEAEGILLEDVDATLKDTSGAVMIGGYINSDKLDNPIADDVQAALKNIVFVANGKQN